jgi:hypothetical protein
MRNRYSKIANQIDREYQLKKRFEEKMKAKQLQKEGKQNNEDNNLSK